MAVATALEVLGARAFLAALGADANDNMLIAVTAWLRQESGGLSAVIGNNPFNIRPGALSYLSVGTRQGRVGTFLLFPDIATGFKAAALLLKSLAPSYGYGEVIKQAQAGNAVSFLAAIALSSWDAAHYGVKDYTVLGIKYTNNAYTTANRLLNVYSTFTGYVPPSAATVAGGTAKKVGANTPGLAAAPGIAGPFAAPSPAPNLAGIAAYKMTWTSARETAKFYAERHHRSTRTGSGSTI